jgi:kynurenine 3-monooxygenase
MSDVVRIVGAGPTGALLAILLENRGRSVELFESRPDPRQRRADAGRSINLALADRGIHALRMAGVFTELAGSLLPMRGRLIHQQNGDTLFQPYGQRPNEEIYSISRYKLNQRLIEIAARRPGIRLHFEHRLEAADFTAGTARFRVLRSGRLLDVPMRPLLAADGAGSGARRSMLEQGLIDAHETDLEHAYKELSIPADPTGGHRMRRDALHIWPRGDHMLIALPNDDGSFTATLFLPRQGALSFAALQDEASIRAFLARSFGDAYALMPDCLAEFKQHPLGYLGTVHAAPWHHGGMAALIGDAAHAMVPFHGQGMNCCFEDCAEFAACADRLPAWEDVFAKFSAERKPDTDAIAAMALENYLEMRELVIDPKFQLQQALSLELERRHPQRFIPRYSMVMFHHEIPYRTAQSRGAIQSDILAELTAGSVSTLADVDFERAARCVESRLAQFSAPG